MLLVTLVVTPVAYSLFDGLSARAWAASFGVLRRRLPAADAVTPLLAAPAARALRYNPPA